jgi:hypothetical protein
VIIQQHLFLTTCPLRPSPASFVVEP